MDFLPPFCWWYIPAFCGWISVPALNFFGLRPHFVSPHGSKHTCPLVIENGNFPHLFLLIGSHLLYWYLFLLFFWPFGIFLIILKLNCSVKRLLDFHQHFCTFCSRRVFKLFHPLSWSLNNIFFTSAHFIFPFSAWILVIFFPNFLLGHSSLSPSYNQSL